MGADQAEAASRRHQLVGKGTLEKAERLAALSPRERQVMEAIVSGKINKVIADELGLSVRTVEVHRARLFAKMGVRSAVELARRAG